MRLRTLGPLGLMLATLTACPEAQVLLPTSLNSPRAMVVARGTRVCLDPVLSQGLFSPRLRSCATNTGGEPVERAELGLVVNDQINRVSVLGWAQDETWPRTIDTDQATPGQTHIPVGELPVDIALSPDATVAYVVNQRDRTMSILDLWVLKSLKQKVELPGSPHAVSVRPEDGQVVVAMKSPSALFVTPGWDCEPPADGMGGDGFAYDSDRLDLRTYEPDGDCKARDGEPSMLELPGTLADMTLDPSGAQAYVVYRDRAYLSVVTLLDGEMCLDGSMQGPCEVARVGLVPGCSDGLDTDGDGLVDQDDPQCFGPLHAESPDGIGRRAIDVCADGLDNDGDGLFDRDDPACLSSAWGSEEEPFPVLTGFRACGDQRDNDGDGRIDTADNACYGAQGRTEDVPSARPFDRVAVDELGMFVYVTDRSQRQVLVVDAKRRALIDVPAAQRPPNPFAETLGVPLGRTPVPTALLGRVTRTVESDDVSTRVRYDYGAQVVTDNGFVYYVDVANVRCRLPEAADLPSDEDFLANPMTSPEAGCLALPSFPLPAGATPPSCVRALSCRECLEGSISYEPGATESVDAGRFDACAPCGGLGGVDAYAEARDACVASERVFTQDGLTLVVNPHFDVRDVAPQQARIAGRARCELQGDQREEGCGSPNVSQPLGIEVPVGGTERPDDFSDEARVNLLEQVELRLEEDGQVTPQVTVYDWRLREETWSVTFEGVLPGTRRADAQVVATPDGVGIDVAGLDLCRAGVQVGDRVVIAFVESPTQECEAFGVPAMEGEDAEAPEGLEYAITKIEGSLLTLEPLMVGMGEEQRPLFEALRTDCFTTFQSYVIRAPGVWVVSGEDTGVASGKVDVDRVCVDAYGVETGLVSSRVGTGEVFRGPLFSFRMYAPSEGEPLRDTRYFFGLERNFSSASTPQGQAINTESPNVSELVHVEGVGGRRYLFALDPGTDSIHMTDLTRQPAVSDVLR